MALAIRKENPRALRGRKQRFAKPISRIKQVHENKTTSCQPNTCA
jgi:hypothetical protein